MNTDIDVTVIVALVTAIAAILAPMVTEIVRSRNQVKLKRMELVYPSKQEAYRNFAAAYGRWSASKDAYSYWIEVVSAAREAMTFAGPRSREALQKLMSCEIGNRDDAFDAAISRLNRELAMQRD